MGRPRTIRYIRLATRVEGCETGERRMSDSEDMFRCGECGHTEPCKIDEVAGREEKRTFAGDIREVEETVVVCPVCGSDDWHSDSVATALLGRDNNE